MTTSLGPLVLTPRLVPKPWGGRRLAALGRDLPADVPVGESWDVADLDVSTTSVPDPVTRVAHGPHAGRTLAELISTHGSQLLGTTPPAPGGRFPLLLKHLDARQDLSVQVHPSQRVLHRLPGAHLKTESWVVIAAKPGAGLMLGVASGVTAEDVDRAFGTTKVVPLLRRVPARVGDVHHVPAGLLHALGAGVVVAEPQTPSDTTYRIYDWAHEYGRAPRPLHRQEAMLCLRAEWAVNVDPPPSRAGDGLLVGTEHYRISRRTTSEGEVDVHERPGPRVVVVVGGRLDLDGLPRPMTAGGIAVLPATWQGVLRASGHTTWLDVDIGGFVGGL
ncbi:type I phosphomannose isomerase catalytic subunit [Jannaschia sp. R86511]|uniref:type I phosphomannose isomerase catalytic subunit n=1 Tax=Jannaschia sp. R86511 TaxID=3093853 RepID=UPI0036D25F71